MFEAIGLLAIIYSLGYLIYHFIRKIFNKERHLSKKIFFSIFGIGIIFLIIGSEFSASGKLVKETNENDELTERNEELITEKKEITDKKNELEKQLEDLTASKSDIEDQLDEAEKQYSALNEQVESDKELESEIEDLNVRIDELESENSSLQSNIDTQSTSVSSNSSDNSSSNATSNTSAYYENCTAAREAGAAPVYEGDPGYASHLDRDGDGVGCE
ncbi:excalibur calcium-binding domain-containing protein [Paraliobacillus sp. X-1268]|uniref:excalibur calcium-binding domain-containing protein n=1 Tax=Paraliobacillus sp. X-1268 TaxID=2213193 RepID=UPI000E3E110C|nr:excalibur calcium-binding domain-containing protein [Paraliobacillus sp. X-1268]